MKSRFFLMFILIAVLISSLVPLYVYADNNSSYEVLVNTDWPSNAYGDIVNDYTFGIHDYTGSPPITNEYQYIYANNDTQQTYYFLVYTALNAVRNGYQIYVCADGPKANLGVTNVRVGTGHYTSNVQLWNNSTYNSTYDISYYSAGSLDENYDNRRFTPGDVNVFNSRDEGLAALRDAIDNGTTGGGGSVTPKAANITVNPGYIAYIGTAGGTAHLEITYPYKFSSAALSNQGYWFSNSLPQGDFTVNTQNNQTYNPIIWNAAGPFDWSRRTYNGEYDITGLGVNYLVIYNPLLSMGFEKSNDAIRVTVTNTVSVVQYPLTSSGSYVNQESYGDSEQVYVADNEHIGDDGSIEYVHYDIDSEGNTTTSSAINLPAGGNNIIDDGNDSTISNFVNQILNLLSAPIKHIQRLFDSGSQFMQWLGDLWGWLPEPVYAVLISALVVLIVIGVIKFLWK